MWAKLRRDGGRADRADTDDTLEEEKRKQACVAQRAARRDARTKRRHDRLMRWKSWLLVMDLRVKPRSPMVKEADTPVSMASGTLMKGPTEPYNKELLKAELKSAAERAIDPTDKLHAATTGPTDSGICAAASDNDSWVDTY